jgi:hypothetical protein
VPSVTTLLLKLTGLARAKLPPATPIRLPPVRVTGLLPRALRLPRVRTPLFSVVVPV